MLHAGVCIHIHVCTYIIHTYIHSYIYIHTEREREIKQDEKGKIIPKELPYPQT